MLRKMVSSVMALTLIACLSPLAAYADTEHRRTSEPIYVLEAEEGESKGDPSVISYGDCGAQGSDVSWTLTFDGTLVISGMGDMADYTSAIQIPWYLEKSMIKRIVINEGVTSVGKGAFYKCSSLESVSLASTVTSIGDKAFFCCESLVFLELPSGHTHIGAYAFQQCGLTSVVIPEGVTSIPDKAFYFNSSLKEATLPEGLTNIGSFAFGSCASLEAITLPVQLLGEGVSVAGNAFINVSAVKRIYTNAGSVEAFWEAADESLNALAFEPLFTNRHAGLEVILVQADTSEYDEAFARLQDLIEYAQLTYPENSSSHYTASSWNAFSDALESALELLGSGKPSIDLMNGSYEELSDAMDSLIDRSSLKRLMDHAFSIDDTAFTEESLIVVGQALAIADYVYRHDESTPDWIEMSEY
ncbi:MAG: leucine-rich repeat domain-containing protein, partial [Eggerthellaceae bacterium]|nr:leucine-rich repeat domain-containing protein [Eggerthellaceae bacterium]